MIETTSDDGFGDDVDAYRLKNPRATLEEANEAAFAFRRAREHVPGDVRISGDQERAEIDDETLCAGDFAAHVDAYRLKNKGVSLEDANEAVYSIRLVHALKDRA